jgi:ABC-type antimicrobial peptide transport system permease subunit
VNLLESVLSGLSSIRTHKLRSGLTLVGIIVGVASVVAMHSFVGGISDRIMADMDRMGFDNVFFISNMRPNNPDGLASLKTSKGLTFEDTEVLRREVPEIVHICPTVGADAVVRAGSEARRVETFGVTPDGFPILKLDIGEGRILGWPDVDGHARVCVLGELIKEKLFADANAVGRDVLIRDVKFRVVGVLRMKEFTDMFGETGQEEFHERIYVPITAAQFYLTGSRSIDYFALRLADGTDIAAAYEKVHATLLREHRMIEDFEIENIAQNIAEAIEGVEQVTRTWNTILGSIAAVSLLVGGIGLLSVLIISVNERLREIGVRKAVGASDADVFRQLLVESVTISTVGGLAGLGLGAGLCKLITFGAAMAGQDFVIPVSGVGAALGISFAVAIGLVFGLYPAAMAARLDPIDAISRYA